MDPDGHYGASGRRLRVGEACSSRGGFRTPKATAGQCVSSNRLDKVSSSCVVCDDAVGQCRGMHSVMDLFYDTMYLSQLEDIRTTVRISVCGIWHPDSIFQVFVLW